MPVCFSCGGSGCERCDGTGSFDGPQPPYSPLPVYDLSYQNWRPPAPKNVKFRRFMILGVPRSGSNWLQESLDYHPEIKCAGELLDHFTGSANPVRILEELWDESIPNRNKAIGFKVFYNHCQQYPEVWEYLKSSDVSVIVLERRNLLAQQTSLAMAFKTDRWGGRQYEANNDAKVRLEAGSIISKFNQIEREMSHKTAIFSKHNTLRISYENLFEDNTIYAIEDFLGVSRLKLYSTLVRQETRPLSEAIENYDEVCSALSGTKYERFLRS